MLKIRFFVFFCIFKALLFSQNKGLDKGYVNKYNLDEVVVTGQLSPKSVKKAVYNVTVVKNTKIKQLAATSIDDVFRQTLNLSVKPNTQTGKSEISLFGLPGKYVKILVDDVPLTNDVSFGNDADLSQINLQDVKRIEIIEGAMAVEYGANAVTGVINIVTKKGSKKKINTSVALQEETVGNEYELFSKGKHIQTFNLDYNLSDEVYTSLSVNREDFAGFYKDRKGKFYFGEEGLRGHSWFPRVQYNTNWFLGFKPKNWDTSYRFSYMNDKIFDYDKKFQENYNPILGLSQPYGKDKTYITERFYHLLSLMRGFSNGSKLKLTLSYQQQQRKKELYNFYIKSHQSDKLSKKMMSKMRVFSSIGSYSFKPQGTKLTAKMGYDIGIKTGLMSDLSIDDESNDVQNKNINHYDFYGVSEYDFNPNLSVRAGVRGMFSELFNPNVAYNFSVKYLVNNWELRCVLGSAPRTPDFYELYYSFVDVNHNLRGNENLKAEKSKSVNLNIKKNIAIGDNIIGDFKLASSFINLKDKIKWLTLTDPNDQDLYTPMNINKYSSFSVSLGNNLTYKERLSFSFGMMGLAVSQDLLNDADFDDSYQYSFEFNSNLTYKIPRYDLTCTLYYKYSGDKVDFITDYQGNVLKGTIKSNDWLDISIGKGILGKKIDFLLGVRNVTNITNQIRSYTNDDNHQGADRISKTEFSYGRSFFCKMIYTIY